MKHLQIITIVLMAVTLSGCETLLSRRDDLSAVHKAALPPYPADLSTCRDAPTDLSKYKKLDAGQIERLWKTDRSTVYQLDQCLGQSEQFYNDVRAGLINENSP